MSKKEQKQREEDEPEFEDVIFVGEFKEVCPFCFAGLRVFDDGIVHALPSCQMFERVDCDEFLSRMKERIKEIAERDRNVN